jgi:hypothetical protein
MIQKQGLILVCFIFTFGFELIFKLHFRLNALELVGLHGKLKTETFASPLMISDKKILKGGLSFLGHRSFHEEAGGSLLLKPLFHLL